MNTPSISHVEASQPGIASVMSQTDAKNQEFVSPDAANSDQHMGHTSMTKSAYVKIWDLPVRIVHWLLVVCFTGAYLTADSESWRLVHITLGYTMGGLIVFRIVWGLIGSRYARFAEFIKGPTAIISYLKA